MAPIACELALERSLDAPGTAPPGPELVETYGRMAALESMSGGVAAACAATGRRRRSSLGEELRLPRELSRAYQWRGLMRCELGDLAGIEDLERGLALALEFREVGVIPAHVNLADQVWRQRGPAAALEIQRTAIEFAERRGGTPTWPKAESCWMLYDLGRWDELLEVAEGIRSVEEAHGAAQPGAMAQTYAALVLIQRGALDASASVAANVLERARKIEDPQVLGPALIASALVAEATGDPSSAVSAVEEYRHVTRNRPYFRAQNLTDAARIACAAGDIALAEGLLDNVVTSRRARSAVCPHRPGDDRRRRGRIRGGCGRVEGTRMWLRAGARASRRRRRRRSKRDSRRARSGGAAGSDGGADGEVAHRPRREAEQRLVEPRQ